MFIAMRVLLFISGLILIAIGGTILLFPEEIYAVNGVILEHEPSLFSEIRAPAGLLLANGLVISVSAFVRAWTVSALLLSALVYSSYGLSRVLSMVLDGMPSDSLVQATAIELILGITCLFGAKIVAQNLEA